MLNESRKQNISEVIRICEYDYYKEAIISFILKGDIKIKVSKIVLNKLDKKRCQFILDFKKMRENDLIRLKTGNIRITSARINLPESRVEASDIIKNEEILQKGKVIKDDEKYNKKKQNL